LWWCPKVGGSESAPPVKKVCQKPHLYLAF